jgi:uncharacterized protein YlxW (UPF0749 family)
MSLLVDMMANTLDEAYAERAAARSAAPPPVPGRASGASPLQRVTAVVALVAVGLVTGTAIAQVRARQEASSGLREELAVEVRERTAEAGRLARDAERLRNEVTALQTAVLGADLEGSAAARRLELLGLASGTLPVRGPGIVVTLDDAGEDTEVEEPLRGGSVGEGRVQDRDLQDLVNGLWAAGAEGVSVNGVRLTALTAIRSAGDTILVDFRPLSPPYEVRAIGDPATLELELVDGPTGRRLSTYVLTYGLELDVRRDRSLSLPGATAPRLRAALPVEERS